VRAQRTAVPSAVRAVGPFTEECDYEVAFEIERPEGRTLSGEQWARAMFEDAPLVLRWFLIVGWTAITCQLGPRRSPTGVLGWRLGRASADTAVLAVEAWIGLRSRLVISVDTDTVTVASFVRYTGRAAPLARAVWAATIPLHERILPYLLTSAARREGDIGAQGSAPISTGKAREDSARAQDVGSSPAAYTTGSVGVGAQRVNDHSGLCAGQRQAPTWSATGTKPSRS